MGVIYKRHVGLYKKLILIIVAILMILFSYDIAYAANEGSKGNTEDENAEIIKEQADTKELKNIQDQLKKYTTSDVKDIIQDYDPQSIITEAASGKFELNIKGIFNNAFKYLFNELYVNIGILIKLIVLIVLCALLKNLQASFMSESVGEIAFYACYIVIVSIMLVSFSTAMKMSINMINNMVDFMYATVPILITLLVSGGNITSGGVFQPVMLMIVQISATLIKNGFIPLIFMSTILSIVNNISDKIQISRLASLIKQITGWALGIILTAFIAVVSIQGSFGAVIDGVASKAAKFAISNFIPVVGKTLSDAADTVIGCTLLIKNAAGLAVMIGVIVICLVPLIKILALVVLYKSVCALVEPISEKRITNCISDVSGSMIHILGITASVSFMFLISITALISASNLSAMIR